MNRTVILFLAVALVAALAGAMTALLIRGDPNTDERGAGPEALLGQPRPPFTLGATDGRVVSAADFDGDVLLVNFWATWCTPCRAEMPMLNEIHESHASRGLSVVGIALDDVQRARDFARDLDIGYTILVGAGDVMATGVAWGNRAGLLPYTVLVGRDGTVRWTYLGELERDELLRRLEPLLEP